MLRAQATQHARNGFRVEFVQGVGTHGRQRVVGAMLARWLTRGITDPIRALTGATRRIASEDFSMHLPEDSLDEVGELSRSFNRMVDHLRRSQAALKHQALTDVVTGLPNRMLLRERLQQAIEPAPAAGTAVALLLLDLDRFKEVNDTLGHHVGDVLLQQVGARLLRELRPADTLARLGGDEFAVVLVERGPHEAEAAAKRLLTALESPFEVEGTNVEIGGSIGIAICPEHGEDADTLLRRADVAMYSAKRNRAGITTYAAGHDPHSPQRLAVVADLRRAIERDELVLYYQPQVDLRSGEIQAFEALVRWQHPQRGLMLPGEFMPLAEETRLIAPLTRWVLKEAVRQCTVWTQAGLDAPVSVNLSACDLHDHLLPDFVGALLDTNGVGPQRLRLEVTETALMADPLGADEVLARLRAQGVQTSIDDFGTGYSSLAYLRQLPVDEIKIDRSFVRDIATDVSARALVRAIVDLADALSLRVIAEGVENEATWGALVALGCDLAQGYYMSAPLPAPQVISWMATAPRPWRTAERGAQTSPTDETLRRAA